jgi:hypothetical protein
MFAELGSHNAKEQLFSNLCTILESMSSSRNAILRPLLQELLKNITVTAAYELFPF